MSIQPRESGPLDNDNNIKHVIQQFFLICSSRGFRNSACSKYSPTPLLLTYYITHMVLTGHHYTKIIMNLYHSGHGQSQSK